MLVICLGVKSDQRVHRYSLLEEAGGETPSLMNYYKFIIYEEYLYLYNKLLWSS